MLQSVLSLIPNFAMTCFLLPVSLCKRIQSVLTRFWWDQKPGETKICWVSWEKLTQPKSLGGLGFRDIQAFNQALLAKLAWRLITAPDCLFSRIILGKYCHKTSFLKVETNTSISHKWRGILKGRDLLLQHLGKVIGNGETTSVWNDSWIQPKKNLKPFGPVFEQDKDLMVVDILTRETKEWNVERINRLLPELASLIFSIKPSVLENRESFIWPLQKSGVYSVKSGYFSLQEAQVIHSNLTWLPENFNWKKFVWNPPLLPKIKFFLWKALQMALPTGENLQKRGLLAHTLCSRCGEVESIDHIFLHCSFTAEVWSFSPWTTQVQIDAHTTFHTLLQSSQTWKNLPPFGCRGNLLPWICWNLWIARNKLLFENRLSTTTEVFHLSIRALKEWEQAQIANPTLSGPRLKPPLQLSPLPNSTVFCNTDAAWKSDSVGITWIFTNSSSTVLQQKALSLNHVSSPCMAEAIAIRGALLNAASLNFTNIYLRSDSQGLIKAINQKVWTIDLYGIFSDIDSLAFSLSFPFSFVRFVFIPRAANGPADCLAKAHLSPFIVT